MDNKLDLETKKIELIKAYKELFDLGIITEEEFSLNKNRILGKVIVSTNLDNKIDEENNEYVNENPTVINIVNDEETNNEIEENSTITKENEAIVNNNEEIVNKKETINNEVVTNDKTPFKKLNIVLFIFTCVALIGSIATAIILFRSFDIFGIVRLEIYAIAFIVAAAALFTVSLLKLLKPNKNILCLVASILSILVAIMFFDIFRYAGEFRFFIAGFIIMIIASILYLVECFLLKLNKLVILIPYASTVVICAVAIVIPMVNQKSSEPVYGTYNGANYVEYQDYVELTSIGEFKQNAITGLNEYDVPTTINNKPVTTLSNLNMKTAVDDVHITFHNNITTLKNGAFKNFNYDYYYVRFDGSMSDWLNIKIEDVHSNPFYFDRLNFAIGNRSYTGGNSYVIPDGVTAITSNHFVGDHEFQLYIPKSVSRIESNAINCRELIISYEGTEQEWNTFGDRNYISTYYNSGYYVYHNADKGEYKVGLEFDNPLAVQTMSTGGTYEYGASVTIFTTPKNGYKFIGWYSEGKLVSSDSTYSFIVEYDITLKAYFEAIN